MKRDEAVTALIQYIAASSDTSFTDEDRARIRNNIQGKLDQAEKLRTVPLENGDEPFSVFTPFRAEG